MQATKQSGKISHCGCCSLSTVIRQITSPLSLFFTSSPLVCVQTWSVEGSEDDGLCDSFHLLRHLAGVSPTGQLHSPSCNRMIQLFLSCFFFFYIYFSCWRILFITPQTVSLSLFTGRKLSRRYGRIFKCCRWYSVPTFVTSFLRRSKGYIYGWQKVAQIHFTMRPTGILHSRWNLSWCLLMHASAWLRAF